MALNDAAKSAMQISVQTLIGTYGIERVTKLGPVRIVQGFIDGGGRKERDSRSNYVEANRAEAEQVVAGLLGMM